MQHPSSKKMLGIDLDKYVFERDTNNIGMATFRLKEMANTIQVRYEEDARITMITISDF